MLKVELTLAEVVRLRRKLLEARHELRCSRPAGALEVIKEALDGE